MGRTLGLPKGLSTRLQPNTTPYLMFKQEFFQCVLITNFNSSSFLWRAAKTEKNINYVGKNDDGDDDDDDGGGGRFQNSTVAQLPLYIPLDNAF